MEKPELRSGTVPSPAIPVVIFTNWREVLNQAPLTAVVRGEATPGAVGPLRPSAL